MRKLKLLFASLALVLGSGATWGQTDVTSTYLTNPSFELGKDGTAAASAESGAFDAPYGWTTENLPSSGTQNFGIFQNDGKTPSNFGKSVAPADGSYYYLGRKSWSGSLAVTFSQTPNLPAGTYALDVAYKIATASSASKGTLQLKATQSSSELAVKESPIGAQKGDNTNYFNDCGWTRISVPFTVAAAGEVKLSIVMNFNPGNNNMKQEAILIDDVRLYNLSAASPTDAADVTGLLTNHSFELDTYTGTKDESSTGTEGNINLPTGWKFLLKTSGWNNCVNVTDAPSHGMYARETWAGTINEVQVSQSLTNLPKGVYGISGVARTNDTGANDICTYGKVGEETTYSAAWDQSKMNATWNGADNWQTLSSIFAVGEEGTAEVGLHSTHFMQFDNFRMTYYGDVTIAEVKLATFVAAYNAALTTANAFTEASMFADGWTALQTAISDNTLDLNDPGLTESQLTTATGNLTAANEAATAAVAKKATYNTAIATIDGGTNVDLTSFIGNPSFESTAAYALVGNGWTNEGVGIQGQTNSGFDGYRVGSVFAERWTGSGSIGAFKTYQTISALPAGIYEVSAVATFNGEGATLFANSTTSAISDVGTYKAVIEIADKGSIELGVQAVAPTGSWFKADNFQLKYLGTIDDLTYTLAEGKMDKDKSAAQTAAETTFLGTKNLDNYNALLAAIAEAEASVANYAALKAAIDKANAEKTANNFVTTAATTTFEGVIATATSAWNDVTYTDQQAKDAVGTLKTAACNYMGSAWITPDPKPEVWWYFNTWSTEGDTDGTDFFNPFFENFKGNTDNLPNNTFTAQLTGLANGTYDVEVWARVQRRTDADFNSDNSMITMSVNDGTAVSLMSGQTTVGSGGSTMRLGRYTARGVVSDGTLTLSINVKLGSNVHWLSWRDVKYTKVADESVAVTDAGYATYVSDNDLDYSSVSGLTAYKATVSGSTINFEKVTTVPAGEGVLLKGAKGSYSVPVTAGVAAWADDNNAFIRGTGAAVETGSNPFNYILNNVGGVVGFYKANGQIVATNRAYLQAPVSASRLNFVFDDEEEVTGIKTINAVKNGEAIYNLNGQRVNKAKNGLYILNGRKVMFK